MLVPGSVNPLLLTSAAGAAGGGISRSIRLNAPDSAYLSRTPGSTTTAERRTWTFSFWIKRTKVATEETILDASASGQYPQGRFGFTSDDKLNFFWYDGSTVYSLVTAAVYRDFSAWYHVVLAFDSTQGTAANRTKLYVNGVEQTLSGSYVAQNTNTDINNTVTHVIGFYQYVSSHYLNSYLADVHMVAGQQLTPSSFTETDATTGQLIPKAYTGSYGTNGFHLEFSDNSGTTSTTLGKDSAGSNNWTPNNFSVSSGAGNDSLVDVPTNGAQTDTGAGGEVRGNYCTLNPLVGTSGLSDGNLKTGGSSANTVLSVGTLGPTSGKWYFEVLIETSTNSPAQVGVLTSQAVIVGKHIGEDAYGWAIFCQTNSSNGQALNNNSFSSSYTTYAQGDIVQCAYDLTNGKIWFGKNGTWLNSGNPASGTNAIFANLPTNGTPVFPALDARNYGSPATLVFNTGQRPFAYTAPSGFKALCTANLPAPVVTKPNTVFDTVLYTGTGSTQTISSLQFNPDFLWIKNRDSAGYNHHLTDIVRGVTQRLRSNTTGAELTTTDQVTAYTSTGFTLGADSAGPGDLECNQSSKTYVAWAWDAGTSTVTNTQGSISSQVRANATAGFSIVTYTGSSSVSTVGHGLGVKPGMFVVKRRTDSGYGWICYHSALGASNMMAWQNTSAAALDFDPWNQTEPTSTVFTVNTTGSGTVNAASKDYLALCWAPVAGYSSFGSYTGNGSSDGPFVFTGHRTRWLLVKRSDSAIDWIIIDTARSTYNEAKAELYPNASAAEGTNGGPVDINSNGFKLRTNSSSWNASSGTYIYAAFAESPFNYARAR
jgi:hypothetical protein